MTHTCHARNCTSRCRPEYLMCPMHWRKVPVGIRRRVYATYRAGQCDDKLPSLEWHQAADAAIGCGGAGRGLPAREAARVPGESVACASAGCLRVRRRNDASVAGATRRREPMVNKMTGDDAHKASRLVSEHSNLKYLIARYREHKGMSLGLVDDDHRTSCVYIQGDQGLSLLLIARAQLEAKLRLMGVEPDPTLDGECFECDGSGRREIG